MQNEISKFRNYIEEYAISPLSDVDMLYHINILRYFKEIEYLYKTEKIFKSEYVVHKQNADNSKEQIVYSLLYLIAKIIFFYKQEYISPFDLLNQGVIGIYKALDQYDEKKGGKFSHYAYEWIRSSISEYIIENSSIIVFPYRVHRNLRLVKEVSNSFLLKNDREPSIEELIKLTNLSKFEIIHAFAFESSKNIVDLEEIIETESEELHVTSNLNPRIVENELYASDRQKEIISIINEKLLEKEKKIIELKYFTINEAKPNNKFTFNEMAKLIGVSEKTARNLHKNAMTKIRNSLD